MFSFLKRRWFVVLLGVILISLVIWYAGPEFAFAGKYPLETELSRLIAILAVFVIWGLVALVKALRAKRAGDQLAAAVVKQSKTDERPSADVVQLRERFEEAVAGLKQKRKGRNSLYDLPWYVIIGAPGSGKTTALVNSGLHFPLEQRSGKGALRGVGGTRNCDWWFTDEGVFLDTAGRYTTQDSDAAADSQGWSEFLTLLRKYRKRRPINGVIVTLSAHDLMTQGPAGRDIHVAATRRRLNELNKELKIKLPVYVLVTKCDLIAGFTEYFDDVVQEGRTQVWGVTFPYEQTQSGAAAGTFPDEFDALITRLNERVYGRLEDVRDVARRAKVFSFPQQVAALRETLTGIVGDLFGATKFDQQVLLRGVYFTSGTQEGTPIDRLLGALGRRFAMAPEAVSSGGKGKAYFIERMLKDVMLAESGLAGVNRKVEIQKAAAQVGAYAAMLLAAVIGVLLLSISFGNNRKAIKTVAEEVDQLGPPPATVTSLSRLLPRLDDLKGVVESAEAYAARSFWSTGWGLSQGATLAEWSRAAYSRELDDALLPYVFGRIQQRLNGSAPDRTTTYQYLKAYLMLGGQHYDPGYVRAIADIEWKTAFSTDRDSALRLSEHFGNLVKYEPELRPLDNDQGLIDRVRASFTQDVIPQLIYSDIKAAYPDNAPGAVRIDPVGIDSVLRRRNGLPFSQPVPSRYSKKVFQTIVPDKIAEFEKEFKADRWVWGNQWPETLRSTEIQFQIRDLYEKDYIRAWDDIVIGLGLAQFSTTDQKKQALATLSGDQSPWRRIYKTVDAETYLVEPVKTGAIANLQKRAGQIGQQVFGADGPPPGEQVTRHFAWIHDLVAGDAGQSAIDALLADIGAMQKQMMLMGSGVGVETNPATVAAVGQMSEGLKQKAKGLPPAVGEIVTEVAGAARSTAREGVADLVGPKYRQDVVGPCSALVAGRFPFGAAPDVRLADFAAVFGPNGAFDMFFKTTLQPYVNSDSRPWTLRTDASGTAPLVLSPSVLRQFENAKAIRDMFFPAGSPQPKVGFRVSIQGVDGDTFPFKLELEGQTRDYRNDAAGARELKITWPGPTVPAAATFNYRSGGPPVPMVKEGEWALFKLFDEAEVAVKNDNYLLTFKKGAHYAQVLIVPDSLLNPFSQNSRDLLKTFRCGG